MNINYEQSSCFNAGAEHSRLQRQRDRRRQLHHVHALDFVKLRQIPHACVGSSLCTSELTMQHRFSDQIECGYDNDISVSDLPNADQITPYAADQMFCLKLSHALIFF